MIYKRELFLIFSYLRPCFTNSTLLISPIINLEKNVFIKDGEFSNNGRVIIMDRKCCFTNCNGNYAPINPLTTNVPIYRNQSDQMSGFYMMGTLVVKGLIKWEHLDYQKDPEEKERWFKIIPRNNIPHCCMQTTLVRKFWNSNLLR